MRPGVPSLVLCLLLASGCGGADEGRPTYDRVQQFEPPDHCAADEGYEFQTMLDFEPFMGGNDMIYEARCAPEFETSFSDCSFYFNYDADTSPASPEEDEPRGGDCIELAVDEDEVVFTSLPFEMGNIPIEEADEARCGENGYALHMVNENVGMCYGANGRLGWGAALDVTFGVLDVSEWDGISLWVRQGDGGEKPGFILQFVDPDTVGAVAGKDAPRPLTVCNSAEDMVGEPPIPDFEKCDNFGTAITLGDEWSFVAVRFDDLAQKGFGFVAPEGKLQTDQIQRMQILVNAGDADFWIDDIALFRERE